MMVYISHWSQDQRALHGKGVHDGLAKSHLAPCGFVISVRLYKNLGTLLETSNCALWLLKTIAPILDVENSCLEKDFLFFFLTLLLFRKC